MRTRLEALQILAVIGLALLAAVTSFAPPRHWEANAAPAEPSRFTADGWRAAVLKRLRKNVVGGIGKAVGRP